MRKLRPPKPLKASKEVRRRARIVLGQAPARRVEADRRKKRPKYKKREMEEL